MQGHVIVIFDAHRSLELPVDAPVDPDRAHAAREWFEQTWESLGCEPLRVSGKVLLLDKILGVADSLGYSRLSAQPELAREFAAHAVQALEKPRVTVDLPGLAIVY
ncbi:hypothetical protein [Castellaniella defragrans]|uniref:Uncharacterized protein n=2 Tax=Castellaniella defragrans TaxID=75697 RepID=W8X1L9_CASD6|nr:hypothetical protein [Castellaniella defragrans]KAB0604444.1 hypothetical protein F7Q88_15395 [Castellaniella defragrans]MBB6084142.1 hypothetical protein [Castellaniella defragrans]CDM22791.1 hypothetical protein BN940_01571 [Castellaniella defragrans 65Phen]